MEDLPGAATKRHHGAVARHLDPLQILAADHVSRKTNAACQVVAASHQAIEIARTAVAASTFQFLAVRYILWQACCMQAIAAANIAKLLKENANGNHLTRSIN